jgi:ribosome-associated protein
MIRITDMISLAEGEVKESFIRASGPGGQNVNKVASAVELRFEAARSPNLAADVKERLKKLAGWRWTQDGALVITSDRFRLQSLNRADALRKLAQLIEKASERPKKRKPTRPTQGAVRRRLDAKSRLGALKALRMRAGEE